MKEHRPPPWLGEFQKNFGIIMRALMDSSSGSFQPAVHSLPEITELNLEPVRSGRKAAGMKAYNRQYWFRLFTALQNEYPLTARLLGFWSFNHLAQAFLLKNPPQHYDLGEISKGFSHFIEITGGNFTSTLPHLALVQASQVDAAVKQVLSSSKKQLWEPSSKDAERLPELRLRASLSWRLITEEWPLLELRFAKEGMPREKAMILPNRLENPQTWLLLMKEESIRRVSLATPQAEFYLALCEKPVGEALSLMEQKYPGDELNSSINLWMAQSVEWGLWVGVS